MVELLVTLCIVAISAGLALPSMGAMLAQFRAGRLASSFSLSVQRARSEAIHRNARVVLCKSADGLRCTKTGGYEQGWLIFEDANNNAQRDPQEGVIEVALQAPAGLQLFGNGPVAHYVSFTGLGTPWLVGGEFQAGTWTVCRTSEQAAVAHSIALAKTGNLRSYKSTQSRCG